MKNTQRSRAKDLEEIRKALQQLTLKVDEAIVNEETYEREHKEQESRLQPTQHKPSAERGGPKIGDIVTYTRVDGKRITGRVARTTAKRIWIRNPPGSWNKETLRAPHNVDIVKEDEHAQRK